MRETFTVHCSPFTICFPFSVFRSLWLTANGQCAVNGKGLIVNGPPGVSYE